MTSGSGTFMQRGSTGVRAISMSQPTERSTGADEALRVAVLDAAQATLSLFCRL
jgi:hypothetical protein